MQKIIGACSMLIVIIGVGMINESIQGSGSLRKDIIMWFSGFVSIIIGFNYLYKESRRKAPLDELDDDDLNDFLN